MTDRPYTDADLRAEAARQHHAITEDPDFVGIGEQMESTPIPSRPDDDWDDLDDDAYEAAQRAIDDLLGGAADVSRWAIDLGADGLQPSTEHALTMQADERPIVRIHFAFDPDMPTEMRNALVEGLGDAIADHLGGAS
ncbi:hypothetical protein RM844_30520 [Streptomyces sp. DSM 44915]|uniref:Uncharacterized protein n=1 Tax=Streptomyces chisholmiae TaxID=3075540 RepID=A0ABU2K038_9ACTN|nr:hypothetical protein [Streptomyces sp. DSM 44915]MDT0270616.1 hypothetical protein [Streptomyces sp. DSM 44915]